jgi:phytanoyl-CoA hydroxylase
MAADAWPLTGVPDLADYESRMMCGRSTIEPRIVPAPVRMPQPPAPHQGSIYENQSSAKNRFFKRAGEKTVA